MKKGLKYPTCSFCAREAGYAGLDSLYNAEIGTCINCGQERYVSGPSSWHRISTPPPKKVA